MERLYRQLTSPTAAADAHMAALARLTRLTRLQMKALANKWVWHNW